MKAAAVLGALVLALTVFFYPVKVHAASPIQNSIVRILNADGTVRSSFSLVNGNAVGGFSVATASLQKDGPTELILGSGLGSAPEVIITKEDGSVVNRFPAYADNAKMGLNVAACDLDGDGTPDIITSPQRGGGPHVRVFDATGQAKASFFAYDETDRNGVNVACGDLNGDGKPELITLPAAGAQPIVRVWDWQNGEMKKTQEFLALDPSDLRGVVGVVKDGNLVVSSEQGSSQTVRTFSLANTATPINDASVSSDISGVNSSAVFNGNVVLASASGAEILGADGSPVVAMEDAPFGALNVAAADLDGDGKQELIVSDGKPSFSEPNGPKSILVDISEQRLYAYENGILENSFLVSTGTKGWETPTGNYHVMAKVPIVHYAGPGWDLGDVPYNLRFIPHHYIHYAYWHNNFGHPMSHGCVNVNLENIKWIYNWADVGIPVDIQS